MRDLEISTEEVIDWLKTLKADYLRINGGDFVENLELNIGSSKPIKNIVDKTNICWFRRWMDNDYLGDLTNENQLNLIIFSKLYNHLRNESNIISTHFWWLLEEKKWLCNPFSTKINKLNVLVLAKKFGLSCPNTIITAKKEDVIEFLDSNCRIISKPISNIISLRIDESRYVLKTIEITKNEVDMMEFTFFPTLFQELIEKEYEVRAFFLNNCFYSMAIFSQNDSKTAIDFRNYNSDRPNRKVPYMLPIDTQQQIKKLMDYLNLNSGSIDLIKSKDGTYFFLEINPVGQFGMTSKPCNYNLEKKIAQYLIQNDN